MRAFIRELLAEKGSVSTMRFSSVVITLSAIVMGFVGLSKPTPDYSGIALLLSTMLGIAQGAKVLQKRVEMSGAKSDTEVSGK